MRIAITNPTTWPWVRRGAERFLNELARFLAQRGHEVTVLSSKPGRREVTVTHGYTTDCHRRLWHPKLAKIGLLEFHVFLATLLPHLLRGRYDVIHCCTFADAFAASLARRVTGAPFVCYLNAVRPRVRYYRTLSTGGAVLRRAIRSADEVISPSRFAHDCYAEAFGRGGLVVPVPVDLDRFKLSRSRDHARPRILCAAALEDARKGGRLLLRAFDLLKRSCPNAVLQLASRVGDDKRKELLGLVSPAWRRDVQFLGDGTLDELPDWYGRAAITVLPSMWESFGMVILESMAAGTPVVGTRDGAIPELIDSPELGRLFDPGSDSTVEPTNATGLAQAMFEALELSQRPGTADRCRAHAERYGWPTIGPVFEDVYRRMTENP